MSILYLLFLFFSILFSKSIWAAKVFTVESTKDLYPLSWETIYKVNVCNAYSTVIEPPTGFVLLDMILGDSKLFKAERSENRGIIKRLAPDAARTNLVLILEGPDKASHSLTFELTGEENPKIANVQFYLPEDKGRDKTIEALRDLYKTQVQMTLAAQEKRLMSTIRERTLQNLEPFHLKGEAFTEERLGAKFTLEAVANSGGNGYVYVFTTATEQGYQVVHLTGIQGKDISKTVKLFRAVPRRDGMLYIYETTPFIKSPEGHKYTFHFRVYKETAHIKAQVK
jgi:hypothetical protein